MNEPTPVDVRTVHVPMSLDYVWLPPVDGPRALLLALHGWGQNARRFARPMEPLTRRGIGIAIAQAPHPFYLDFETKKIGFSWLTAYERDRAVQDLHAYLATVLQDVHARLSTDKALPVFLFGFSQGVSIATRFAVSGRITPAGLIGCCADLPPDAAECLPNIAAFPVLLACSPDDAIVSPDKTRDAAASFKAHGFDTTLLEFEGGHRLPPALMEQIAGWLVDHG